MPLYSQQHTGVTHEAPETPSTKTTKRKATKPPEPKEQPIAEQPDSSPVD